VGVIASLLWPGMLLRPEPASFHVQLGDLPTWLLAVFALGALVAAGLAYRAQRDDLADQRKANALQATVLERTLGALARQQADQVSFVLDAARELIPGRKGPAESLNQVTVTNGSARPIRHVVARLLTPQNGETHLAEAVAIQRQSTATSLVPDIYHYLDDYQVADEIKLLCAEGTRAFIFPVDATHEALVTLRFTDDAGLHWQVDNDLHLEPLDSRDW
jgi:hypothetical protein